ncbi:MAG: geranylgeranylglycerol-phosphate geranylgeranyltransferase [Candidatus Thorarchaeota archaeon]|jgi:geranylgeranylglycerol-phosphate geranylgeranyltransferase
MTESSLETDSPKRFYPLAFLQIIRPQNCFIGGLTVLAGVAMAYNLARIGAISIHIPLFIYGYITYFFVAAGGNVVNDIFDIEVDKINRPHRALPSGRMTIKQAWAYVAFLSIVGLLFAILTGPYSALIVLIFLIIGYVYAAKVKTLGLAGNFMVAFSFAFGILYGAFAFGETVGFPLTNTIPIPHWLFFFTAFLILQARETIKGAEDVEGDAARDVRTIARIYGYNVAAAVAAALNFIGVLSYVLIWVWGFASWDLWPLLLLGAGIVTGAGIAPLTGPENKRALLIGSTLDKVGALVGLIAFVIIPLYGILI